MARLVALAWCDGYEDGLTVNHIDGNYMNNNASNLEWVTRKENVQKGFANGLFEANMKKCELITDNKVYRFNSMSEASRFLGRNVGYLSYKVKRDKWTAKSKSGKVYEIRIIDKVN